MSDTVGQPSLALNGISLGEVPARPRVRTPAQSLLRYGLWVLLALLPGFIAHMQWHVLGPKFAWFVEAMQDIRWGGGLRFWCGVAGASIMALLLLYPLKKQFLTGPRWGSVGFWYQSHIVLGLAGPVLILYHCNFGLGALNSNMALYSTFLVVFSGGVGYLLTSRFGLWRVLHLPVFAITVIATVAHVYGVWGVDSNRGFVAADPAMVGGAADLADNPADAPADAAQPSATPANAPVEADSEIRAATTLNENGLMAADAVPPPEPVSPPPKKPRAVAVAVVAAEAPGQDQQTDAPPPDATAATDSMAAPVVPAPPPKLAAKAKPQPKPAAVEPPMDRLTQLTGFARANDFGTLSMGDVLAGLKKTSFNHNADTRFKLTGAHVRTPCASCHKTEIKDTPKECRSCHAKDDVHHGRRPQCGRCHSTSRW